MGDGEKLIKYQPSLICDIINQAAPPSLRHLSDCEETRIG